MPLSICLNPQHLKKLTTQRHQTACQMACYHVAGRVQIYEQPWSMAQGHVVGHPTRLALYPIQMCIQNQEGHVRWTTSRSVSVDSYLQLYN